jgi:hypothetical protein
MAKFGKFVGKEFKAFNDNELKSFENVIKTVFGSVGTVRLESVDNESVCSAVFKVALNDNEKIGKVADRNHKGNYAYGITELTFMAFKHEGQLEKSIGVYEGEKFIQYDLKAWTNGKYHEYRRRHENDFKFEGKNHYAYDTEINGFESDLRNWGNNVWWGIDY